MCVFLILFFSFQNAIKFNFPSNSSSDLESRLSGALKELQQNTMEMERNRVIPELIGLYNAETEVHKLLRNTEYTTKLIGKHNKRVITAFNPSDAILFLDHINTIDNKDVDVDKGLTAIATDANNARENLDEPLHWDQNWTWDY